VFICVLLPNSAGKDGGPVTEVLLGPGQSKVQNCVLSLEEAASAYLCAVFAYLIVLGRWSS
jgi:hypothetical protein